MYQEDPTSYYQQRVFALGTPLHSAARLGRLDICRILVAKGADVRIRDSRGEIPLQRAEKGGWMAVIDFLAPLTERARSPVEQFTRGKEATAWG
jgi:ankyrin repeat protein